MSLDGALLHCVKEELKALIGGRVDKIYQPSKEEIVILLRMLNGKDRSAGKIIFSANGSSARVNLTSADFDNPQTPPMFCMLLRKHLSGGKLTDIRQDGLERILYFDFECVNEIGDIVINTLTAELMGRYSNIILMRDGRVIDSVKRIADEEKGLRRILPNIVYEAPPKQDRFNLLDTPSAEITAQLVGKTERLAKVLMNTLEGISPVFARECAFYSAGDAEVPCDKLNSESLNKLNDFLDHARSALSGNADYTLLKDENSKNKDLCFVDIKQYADAYGVFRFDTANELLDAFFRDESNSERTRQKAHDLLKLLNTARERVSRKLELQRRELSACSEREEFRVCGELIGANIYRLEKGMTKAVVEDYYTGGQREIKLDPRLSPSQNAQKYFTEYKKLLTAEQKLTEFIKKGEDELIYIDSVLDSVSRAETDAELGEIRRELAEQGYRRSSAGNDAKPKKLSEPLKFTSGDGFTILVGKNNRQNDQLTLKTARACDIWLHTQNIAGSHVIIVTEGKTPPESTLVEAAKLAALHSKARNSSRVPVDYTAVKFVKKPAGAKPGMVIFTNNKTLYVTPESNTEERK